MTRVVTENWLSDGQVWATAANGRKQVVFDRWQGRFLLATRVVGEEGFSEEIIFDMEDARRFFREAAELTR